VRALVTAFGGGERLWWELYLILIEYGGDSSCSPYLFLKAVVLWAGWTGGVGPKSSGWVRALVTAFGGGERLWWELYLILIEYGGDSSCSPYLFLKAVVLWAGWTGGVGPKSSGWVRALVTAFGGGERLWWELYLILIEYGGDSSCSPYLFLKAVVLWAGWTGGVGPKSSGWVRALVTAFGGGERLWWELYLILIEYGGDSSCSPYLFLKAVVLWAGWTGGVGHKSSGWVRALVTAFGGGERLWWELYLILIEYGGDSSCSPYLFLKAVVLWAGWTGGVGYKSSGWVRALVTAFGGGERLWWELYLILIEYGGDSSCSPYLFLKAVVLWAGWTGGVGPKSSGWVRALVTAFGGGERLWWELYLILIEYGGDSSCSPYLFLKAVVLWAGWTGGVGHKSSGWVRALVTAFGGGERLWWELYLILIEYGGDSSCSPYLFLKAVVLWAGWTGGVGPKSSGWVRALVTAFGGGERLWWELYLILIEYGGDSSCSPYLFLKAVVLWAGWTGGVGHKSFRVGESACYRFWGR
jgi:hypothetical protein